MSERVSQVLAALSYGEYVDAWVDIPFDIRSHFKAYFVGRPHADGSESFGWIVTCRIGRESIPYCPKCGEQLTWGEPDPCIGWLPGVAHTCCGHGNPRDAYVIIGGQPNQACTEIPHYIDLRDQDALDFFALLGRGKEVKQNV